MKICFSCKTEKPFTEFHKAANTKSGYHCYCKPCVKEKNRQWAIDNKEQQALSCSNWYKKNKKRANLNATRWHYKKYYGISYEEFLALAQTQKNQCKLCNVDLTFDSTKAKTRAVLDHCHTTGKIRGVLCNKCNIGLGTFNDDIMLLKAAMIYLENSNQTTIS